MFYLISASESKILIIFGMGAKKVLAFVGSNLFRQLVLSSFHYIEQVVWYVGGILLLNLPPVTKGL